MKHIPVLADSVLRAIQQKAPVKTYVDLTLGLGGHASLIATQLKPDRIIGFDRDKDMLEIGERNLRNELIKAQLNIDCTFIHSNYSQLDERFPEPIGADAILLDLGVASPHFDDPDRGLSFRFDGPLDMRLDRSQGFTAADIVNTYTEQKLGRVLKEFGEEWHWRAVARTLVALRKEKGFTGLKTTKQLVDVVEPILGPRKGRIHPVTKVFQALRMEVNAELSHLEKAIPMAIRHLGPGGKLVIISFHSLEDRIVKKAFLNAFEQKQASHITKNHVEAQKAEIAQNPRSRSAKLRVLTKSNLLRLHEC